MSGSDPVLRLPALGVDLGGSSARAHVMSSDGQGHKRILAGGNVSLDATAVRDTLLPLIEETRPVAACLGLAGGRTAPDAARWLAEELSRTGCTVIVMSDAELAMRASFGPDADGILICAGTGTVAVGRVDGELDVVGGMGFLLGDQGGGYDIGRRIVAAALRDCDLGSTELAAELAPFLDDSLRGFVAKVYLQPGNRQPLAALATHVPHLQHAAGDRVLNDAADALIDLGRLAQERFGDLPVQLTGGVFRSERIAAAVGTAFDATVSQAEPEVVAAQIAAEAA